LVVISDGTPIILTEVFRVFPQLLQANARIVHESCKEGFLTNILKFVNSTFTIPAIITCYVVGDAE
jgi:hypothetical protein